MRDYAKLVKALRVCGSAPYDCSDCPIESDECNGVMSLFSKAADAIEELLAKLDELPEHGELIDRDAFRAENEYYLNREFINPKYEDTLDDLLKDAPVIVPANKEESE